MEKRKRRFGSSWIILFLVTIPLLIQISPCIGAEDPAKFPSRAIKVIVPWPAGGTCDMSARKITDVASKILGQPVVVENKVGGSGITGVSAAVKADPDGYTMGVTTYSTITVLPHLRSVPFNINEDFGWMMQYAKFSNVVVALSSSPWKTFRDFIEDARKNPGQLKYAPPGPLTAQHILLEAIFAKENVKVTFVPVRGGSEANRNLLGGHIDVAASASIWPHIKAGTVRGLMVTQSRERLKEFPDIPTQYELDLNIDAPNFVGLFVPKGVDPRIFKKLADGFKKAWEDPSFKKFLAGINMVPVYKDSKSFEATVFGHFESQGKALDELGLLKKFKKK